MFNETHYVPILKWKRGEQVALQHLSPEVKSRLTPLIEIIPRENIEGQITEIPRQIQTYWGEDRPIFVDLNLLGELEQLENGQHPLRFLAEHARQLQIIPVTNFDREDDFQDEIKSFHLRTNRGACIRITDEHFMDIAQQLNTLVNKLEIPRQQIDLIIDLYEINRNDEGRSLIAATFAINSIPDIHEWRTLTLASSAFPRDLSMIPTGSNGSFPRSEWHIWTELYRRRHSIRRFPTFGDYAINNPVFMEIDPRIMRLAANIRYTTENEFLIFRGRSIKTAGWEQARELAQRVIRHPEYSGARFSWGDQYIEQCAAGNEGTGNAETWRRVGTNHHLTLVVSVLSNFFET
jgi:hypothetical protein